MYLRSPSSNPLRLTSTEPPPKPLATGGSSYSPVIRGAFLMSFSCPSNFEPLAHTAVIDSPDSSLALLKVLVHLLLPMRSRSPVLLAQMTHVSVAFLAQRRAVIFNFHPRLIALRHQSQRNPRDHGVRDYVHILDSPGLWVELGIHPHRPQITVRHRKHHALFIRRWHGMNEVRIPSRRPHPLFVCAEERYYLLHRRKRNKREFFLGMYPNDSRTRTGPGRTA